MDELHHGGECPVKMQLKKGYAEGQKSGEEKYKKQQETCRCNSVASFVSKMSLNSISHNRIIEAIILMQLQSAIMHFYMRLSATLPPPLPPIRRCILHTPRSAMVKVEKERNT